ncbi:T9SS sorting signal type C domain-containing protein [Chishuiella sp.]|uniref:T9SS sorting signal type C domain-containing protein n=1 Tax=Chishuiella sp. TaxID=1969467 RepID=UPI0028A886D2|nr:T9SS sorting signal type C domain-containing protein [Chishuiella sp.]
MKKNLLALFALGGIFSTSYAQDTYINDAVVVKVNPSTLFYNGGAVAVNTSNTTDTTEKIINEGNIQIEGNFSNANTTGKNFVNRYTNDTSYGQLRINDGSNVTGKVIMERVKPNITSSNEYLTALPFQNITAEALINTITGGTIFSGECGVNVNCGTTKRAQQSLLVWDIAETEYDAVPTGTKIIPYKRYLLQFKDNNSLVTAFNSLTSATKIGLTGYPNNAAVTETIKSGWRTGQDYADVLYPNWKNNTNNYGQQYYTYLGNTATDVLFGKNQHRLANPYTSNLDLSNITKGGASWIKFTTAGGLQSPTEVFDTALRFQIVKIANGYTMDWGSGFGSGSKSSDTTTFAAYLKKNDAGTFFWTGSWQALLVKPYETFYIDYYKLNKTGNNGTRLISATLNLSDANKTFAYDYSNVSTDATGLPNGVYARSANSTTNNKVSTLLNNEDLKAKGLVTDFDFTQLELYVSNKSEKTIQGSAAYLLNASFMKTGDSTTATTVSNPVFFYEENESGDVLTDVQTTSNEFNSEDYIGKPIRVGFNKLTEGTTYNLNLNLYEYSILNEVKNLNLGKYYLYDKVKNTVTEVNESTEVTFTADDKINDRFEFYWNEKPSSTLSTDDLTKTNTTYLYSDANRNQFVRFEKSNTTADISVFDLTGRQIFSKNAVSTNSDYQLNFINIPSIYVVKITYKDGKTVTKKTIKK